MERFGFVGLPNAGKSSLFNALAGGGALAAPYAFATTDPNVGVVKVPDHRLDALAKMSKSKKVVNSTTEFVDIGGLVEGASQGEGLGNKFLAGIREVDALVLVLRTFSDADVPGPTDPLEHLRVVEIELTLADLETVESRIDRRQKALRADPRDPGLMAEVDALETALESLSDGTPLYRAALSKDRQLALREHFLLTNKPVMAVLNIGEDQLGEASQLASQLEEALPESQVLPLSVQLEAEAAMLPDDERTELLEGLGLGEGALPVFVRAAHGMLGLRTFLTTGEKESRAWTFKHGWKAPQCAGRIHTDFERGFIRAEVIAHEDLLTLGSWTAAREAGQLRLEGKDYEMRDGDVVEFRFNV
ncbi:MAG: redox-regulated ATPase YchF [Actinomycetota bacterium]|jgi:GTP-binding protein YchF|nr:redox-regulated ATPase YchF [Actinomycetota bacterium]|tara:strand:- start:9 stop:1091 length:1083 start_codon:yes stop_codon:yes gene_type:complete